MDLIVHLRRQADWMLSTFGPMAGGQTWRGTLDHLRREADEVEACEARDVEECADIIMLAFATAIRGGHSPEEIVQAIEAKQTKNENRTWPDWRTSEPGKAIEHVRDEEVK